MMSCLLSPALSVGNRKAPSNSLCSSSQLSKLNTLVSRFDFLTSWVHKVGFSTSTLGNSRELWWGSVNPSLFYGKIALASFGMSMDHVFRIPNWGSMENMSKFTRLMEERFNTGVVLENPEHMATLGTGCGSVFKRDIGNRWFWICQGEIYCIPANVVVRGDGE